MGKGIAAKFYHPTAKGLYYLAVVKGERERNKEYEDRLDKDPNAKEE